MSNKDLDSTVASCTIAVILAVPLVIVSSILNGWALSVLWGWFIAPLFEIPNLTIPYAIGLSMAVSFLTKNYNIGSDKDKTWGQILTNWFMNTVGGPLLGVGIGLVVLQFI